MFGIGTDIIEVERVRKAGERWGEKFLKRVFTPGEVAFCRSRRDRWACLAGRLAAKEAVLKALGVGLSGCRWVDVEVERKAGGRPGVILSGAAARIAGEQGVEEVLLSIAHDRGKAVAFAVAVKRRG